MSLKQISALREQPGSVLPHPALKQVARPERRVEAAAKPHKEPVVTVVQRWLDLSA
jgi:hypothetical protein